MAAVSREHSREHVEVGRRAQHCSGAQQCAVRRCESVDLRGHDRLDGAGKFDRAAAGAHCMHELDQEQRVAVRSCDQRAGDVRWQRRVLGHRRDGLQRLAAAERRQLEALGVGWCHGSDACADHHQPGRRRDLRDHALQKVPGRVIHEMRVLENEDGRLRHERPQQRQGRVLLAIPPELLVQGRSLRRLRDRDARHCRCQWQPGSKIFGTVHLAMQRGDDVVRVGIVIQIHRLAQEASKRCVRRRLVVLITVHHEAPIGCRCRHRVAHQTRLAQSGVADDDASPARSLAGRLPRLSDREQLSSPSDEQWFVGVADVTYVGPASRTDAERLHGVRLALDHERFERLRVETASRAVEQCFRREDVAVLRFPEQSRSEVDGVALD